MARLKVLHPGNHNSSGNIGGEFESIVRYLNAAEIGDKTISELLRQLFNSEGEWAGPIQFRLTEANLEYRVGKYTEAEEGWNALASIDELKGPAGQDVGNIGAPLFSQRVDVIATAGQTVIPYAHNESDEVVVYVNGLLQDQSTYTASFAADTITFTTPLNLDDKVTIYRIQGATDSGYDRTDIISTAGQAVFPYVHTEEQQIIVYRNGILQRFGGSYDYTNAPSTDTITFTTPLSLNDVVTVMTVTDTSAVRVTGLMTEDGYTDENGLIPYSKLAIADEQIPPSKIATLSDLLSNRGRTYVSAQEPTEVSVGRPINAGDKWIDTSTSPNTLRFYNGSNFLTTSPETGIPVFGQDQATLYLRVNSTGTGLEFATIDSSALIPKVWKGAANGVAGLDAEGKLPVAQLPDTFSTRSYFLTLPGAVTDGTTVIHRAYKQQIRVDGIAVKAGAGTANIQLNVNGTAVGDVIAVSSTLVEHNLSNSVVIDGTSSSKEFGFTVSSATSLSDLQVTIATVTTNV